MKKMLIACFFAVLMLMVPFTAFGQTTNIPTAKNIDNAGMDTPEFYLTQEQMKQVNNFINNMFDEEEKIIAESIRDYIIDTNTRRVDIVKLANALLEYTYQPIPQEELDLVQTKEQLAQLIELYWILDAFGAFVFFITSLVSNRLGWLYDLINDGYGLVNKGVQITISILHESIDVVLDLVDAINLMLTIPQVFQDLMVKLFNKQYEQFKTAALE